MKPAFGVPSVDVDHELRSAQHVWITSDEYAAGCAAMAYYAMSGSTAQLVAGIGPGIEMAYPALAISAAEQLLVEVRTSQNSWTPQLPPETARLANGFNEPALVLVRYADRYRLSSVPSTPRIVTEGSALPGAALFGERWLGHAGYGALPEVLEELATYRLVTLDGIPASLPIPAMGPAGESNPAVDEAVRELDALLPAESPIVCDAGMSHEAVARIVARAGHRPVVQTTRLTTMGWSLGAALGVHVATQQRPFGVVIGDGSLMMRLGDIATLVRYGVQVVITVLENGLVGGNRAGWNTKDRERIAQLPAIGWPAALSALGAEVHNSLESALAAVTSGPQVVMVRTTS